jgi:hypothetical protein
MSFTGTLLFATGLIHNIMGIMSPRLREPLQRLIADGGTVVVADEKERYARENTFWFQFAGIAIMIHGLHVRNMALQAKKANDLEDDETTNPSWLGWAVLGSGVLGTYCKPVSGFHMLYVQGLRLLWIDYKHNKSKKKQ